ncbi:DUF2065 domain-containing protein [uncultured Litoreibacter sp.]|uniref:DUF2065 domain-containing protein n=1 Tax=uncultured Litoreibacter sp. TaxID=1392394 RepID=UPI00262C6336|nr:DUF2065 domain-containing protein [uncultured Litoreibacter sp.]
MITHILLAIGLVMVVEGLVFALAPSRLEELIKAIADIPPETRRLLGLGCVAFGVFLVWLAKGAFGS